MKQRIMVVLFGIFLLSACANNYSSDLVKYPLAKLNTPIGATTNDRTYELKYGVIVNVVSGQRFLSTNLNIFEPAVAVVLTSYPVSCGTNFAEKQEGLSVAMIFDWEDGLSYEIYFAYKDSLGSGIGHHMTTESLGSLFTDSPQFVEGDVDFAYYIDGDLRRSISGNFVVTNCLR